MNNRWLINKIVNADTGYPKATFSTPYRLNTCVNPYSYHILRNNRDLFHDYDGIFVDGILMCIFIRLVWGKKVRRLSFDMTSMAKDLFEEINKSRESIYFIGTSQDKLEQSISVLKKEYPNLNIIGYRNGYFDSGQDRVDTIQNIIGLNPKYVIVGMGSPLQEQFGLDLRNNGYKGILFTCGGFLHQTADGLHYYPKWVDKYNLRGFYRQYKEKILIRNYNSLIEFPALFIYDSIKSWFSKNKD